MIYNLRRNVRSMQHKFWPGPNIVYFWFTNSNFALNQQPTLICTKKTAKFHIRIKIEMFDYPSGKIHDYYLQRRYAVHRYKLNIQHHSVQHLLKQALLQLPLPGISWICTCTVTINATTRSAPHPPEGGDGDAFANCAPNVVSHVSICSFASSSGRIKHRGAMRMRQIWELRI